MERIKFFGLELNQNKYPFFLAELDNLLSSIINYKWWQSDVISGCPVCIKILGKNNLPKPNTHKCIVSDIAMFVMLFMFDIINFPCNK
jgi:hypothetical protein